MNVGANALSDTLPDWRDVSLLPGGRCLIEASAGTGKTWTISVIYLRLLLEQGLSPTRIVVTTFTDAAAQELRERIRGRILWAIGVANAALQLAELHPAASKVEADEAWLRERWSVGGDGIPAASAKADLLRLQLALVDLDRAPIGTLHSLCRRILSELPFDSASAFDLGDMVSTDSINDELVDDLLRRLGQGEGELSEGDAAWWNDRRGLRDNLRTALSLGVEIEQVSEEGVAELKDPANLKLLDAALSDVASYTRSNSALLSGFRALRVCIAGDELDSKSANALAKLGETLEVSLDERLKTNAKNRKACELAYDFSKTCVDVLERIPNIARSRSLKEFQTALRAQRQQRLAARGQVTFDALIERVAQAVGDPQSSLADALFERWPVALVDEFQDTDAQQYRILDAIYRSDDAQRSARGLLVMIGDPKQAIYRFRGGDIEAYVSARESATSALRLDTNFRSSAPLVGALNNLFERAGVSLSSQPEHEIGYQNVVASRRNETTPYRINGEICTTPLHIHYWNEDVPDAAPERAAAALEACANQIVDLLASGEHMIGEQPLRPGDIAVLLPTNGQVTQLRDLLDERQVPCVTTARSSVFDSDWARDVQVTLHAALHPRDGAAVRAALATRLGGKSYKDLRELGNDPIAFEIESQRYAALGETWRNVGVLATIQRVIRERGSELFAAGDAERAMTDLNHLGELLQAQADQSIGAEQVLQWLSAQRDGSGSDAGEAADEQQMRIESDAARVRVMTLHASKGLEFPIVILPLMWANAYRDGDRIAVLHHAASGQRVLSFGGDALERYRWTGQDERYRLLYVAMTRAIHACHVYALPPDRVTNARNKNAPTDPKRAPLDALIERLLKHASSPDSLAGVAWLAGRWAWDERRYQPDAGGTDQPRVAMAEPPPAPFESRYSFTSLTHSQTHAVSKESPADDEPDGESGSSSSTDATTAPSGSAHPELLRLKSVGGSDFGNALHAIFEHRVIGVAMSDQSDLIRRSLVENAVPLRELSLEKLVPLVAVRIQSTLNAPLLPQTSPGLSLSALKPRQMRAEMAFDFVLDEVSMSQLREACESVGEDHLIPPGLARSLRGLMTGKIDLVFEFNNRFHVLDYKSNYLGDQLPGYAASALDVTMDASHYRFQALLYTVAVDRYLRQRIAGYSRREQLGAAIYLFVRATGIDADYGIWAHRFDDDLIDAVDAALGRTANEEGA